MQGRATPKLGCRPGLAPERVRQEPRRVSALLDRALPTEWKGCRVADLRQIRAMLNQNNRSNIDGICELWLSYVGDDIQAFPALDARRIRVQRGLSQPKRESRRGRQTGGLATS